MNGFVWVFLSLWEFVYYFCSFVVRDVVDMLLFFICRVVVYYNCFYFRYLFFIFDVELLVVIGGVSIWGEWFYNVDNYLDMCMICVFWCVVMFYLCD